MPGHKGKGQGKASSKNTARDHRKYKPTFSNAHASTRNDKAEEKSAIKEVEEKTEQSQKNGNLKSKKQRGNKRYAGTKVVSAKTEEEKADKTKQTNAEAASSKVKIEKTSKKGANNKKKVSIKATCLNAGNDSENNAKIDADTNVNKKKDVKVNINEIKKAHFKSLRKMAGHVTATADGAEVKNNNTNVEVATAKRTSKRLEEKQQKASTKAANVNANADNNLDNTAETTATVEIKLPITKKKQTPGKKQRKNAANKKNDNCSKAAVAKNNHDLQSTKHVDNQPGTSSQAVKPGCSENNAQAKTAAVKNKAKNAHTQSDLDPEPVNETVNTGNYQRNAKLLKPERPRKSHVTRQFTRSVRNNQLDFVNSFKRRGRGGLHREYLILEGECDCEKASSPLMFVGLEHGDVYYTQHKFSPNMRTGYPCKHKKLIRLNRKGPNPQPNNYK